MGFEGKSLYFQPFSTTNTVVKAKFDTSEITDFFQETLRHQLEKKGLVISKGEGEAQIMIRGQVVTVDEGNRWLRYFLTFLGGKTVFEVEGEVLINSVPAGEVHSAKKSGIGVFGGNSEGLLKANAKAAAKDITGQVIKLLKRSQI
jgi:hypothetical protein